MTNTDKILLIERLRSRYSYIDEVHKNICLVFGPVVESPIMDAMWVFFGDMVDIVAEKIGDNGGWLEWFIWEDEWGRKEYDAGYDDDVRPIKTIEDLLWVIGLER